jgi:hypothetical protein
VSELKSMKRRVCLYKRAAQWPAVFGKSLYTSAQSLFAFAGSSTMSATALTPGVMRSPSLF